MLNDSLKELLRIYSHLPSGLIIFKGKELYFVNNHLREVLVLGELPVARSLEILCRTLGLTESSEALCAFLESRRFFTYKEKYLQITHRSLEPYDIYLFTRIDPALLEYLGAPVADAGQLPAEAEVLPKTAVDTTMHNELLEHFETARRSEATGYVIYRGVPLIGRNTILQPFKGTLVIKAEEKQMIAATAEAPWILKTDSGLTVQGSVIHSDRRKQHVFLSALQTVGSGFHQREHIRYRIDEPVQLQLDLGPMQAQLQLLDLSECSLRAATKHAAVLETILKTQGDIRGTLMVEQTPISLQCRFLKEAGRSEGEAHLVFTFGCSETALAILRNWLYARQLSVIKEINAFTREIERLP